MVNGKGVFCKYSFCACAELPAELPEEYFISKNIFQIVEQILNGLFVDNMLISFSKCFEANVVQGHCYHF